MRVRITLSQLFFSSIVIPHEWEILMEGGTVAVEKILRYQCGAKTANKDL